MDGEEPCGWLSETHKRLLASTEREVMDENLKHPEAFLMFRDIYVDITMVEIWKKFRSRVSCDHRDTPKIDDMLTLFKEALKHRLCSRCGNENFPEVLHPDQWYLDMVSLSES